MAAVQAARNAGALVRLYYFKEGDTSYGERLYDAVDERFDLVEVLKSIRDGTPDPRRTQQVQAKPAF